MKRPPTSIIRFLYISDISLWCPEFRRNDPERNAKLGVLKCMPDHIAGEIYLADYLLYRLNRRDWWPLVVLLVDGLKVRKFTKVHYSNVDFIFMVFQCSMVRACHKTVAGIGSLTMSLSTLAMSFNFSRRQTVDCPWLRLELPAPTDDIRYLCAHIFDILLRKDLKARLWCLICLICLICLHLRLNPLEKSSKSQKGEPKPRWKRRSVLPGFVAQGKAWKGHPIPTYSKCMEPDCRCWSCFCLTMITITMLCSYDKLYRLYHAISLYLCYKL